MKTNKNYMKSINKMLTANNNNNIHRFFTNCPEDITKYAETSMRKTVIKHRSTGKTEYKY